jgi:hypothetical protein
MESLPTYQYPYQKMGIFIYMSYILNMYYFMYAFCLYNMIRNPSYLYLNSLLVLYYIDFCSVYEKILIMKAIIFMIIYYNSEKVNKKLNRLNIARESLMVLGDTDAQNTNIFLYYINKTERVIKNKFNQVFSKVDIIANNIKNIKLVQNIITTVDTYLNMFINKLIEKHKEIYNNIINNILNIDKKNKEINEDIDTNLKEIDSLMLELEQLKDDELDDEYKEDIQKKKESLEFIKNINFKQMMETIMKVKVMKVDKKDK